MNSYAAKLELVGAVLRLVQSDYYLGEHPENPNGDAESESNDDRLLEAAKKYVESRA